MRIACLLCYCVGAADAATFCVDSTSELESALMTAQINGENNEIRLKPGVYPTPNGGFMVEVPQGTELKVSGGWEDRVAGPVFLPCFSQDHNAWASTIDGRGVSVGLTITLEGDNSYAFVENLTFSDGNGPSVSGGGLDVEGDFGSINGAIINNNVFVNNSARYGAGVSVWVSTILQFYNNLVFLNDSEDGAACSFTLGDGHAFISNNTIMFNSNDTNEDASGLWLTGFGNAVLANNLAIDNEWGDFRFVPLGDLFLLMNNAFDEVNGPFDPNSSGNIIGPNPLFQPGLINFRPSRQSVLVDAGTTDIFGTISELDLDRKPRIIGPQIDIGAYENDLLLEATFEDASPF